MAIYIQLSTINSPKMIAQSYEIKHRTVFPDASLSNANKHRGSIHQSQIHRAQLKLILQDGRQSFNLESIRTR